MLLVAYAALWPMVLNTAGAVASVHPRQYDVARTLHLTRWRRFARWSCPQSPVWLVGARLSVIVALLVAIVVEMVHHAARPRRRNWFESLNALAPERMWAYALVCGLIGVC